MKNEYIAPEVTAVEFHAERGFADSFTNTVGTLKDYTELWSSHEGVFALNTADLLGGDGGIGAGHFSEGNTGGWGFTTGWSPDQGGGGGRFGTAF